MATITKFATPVLQTPRNPTERDTVIALTIPVVSGDANNGDDITILTPPAGARLHGFTFGHSATLGAAATAQLRQGTTAITAATTAGGASRGLQTVVAAPADGAQTLNVLIGGANITASANIEITGFMTLPNG